METGIFVITAVEHIMLRAIAAVSPELAQFFEALNFSQVLGRYMLTPVPT